MKVLTNLTAIHVKNKGEFNNKISETIPDQAISAQELLRRFATGVPLGFKNAQPIYDDDEENPVPELYKMDQLDRLHHLQESSENLLEKRSEFNDYQKQKQKQQADQAKQKQNKDQPPTETKAENSKRSVETSA